MENNEIMNNEEIEEIETTEEIVETEANKGFNIPVGIGICAVVGFAAYKCVIKPVVKRIKIANEMKKIMNELDKRKIDRDELLNDIVFEEPEI